MDESRTGKLCSQCYVKLLLFRHLDVERDTKLSKMRKRKSVALDRHVQLREKKHYRVFYCDHVQCNAEHGDIDVHADTSMLELVESDEFGQGRSDVFKRASLRREYKKVSTLFRPEYGASGECSALRNFKPVRKTIVVIPQVESMHSLAMLSVVFLFLLIISIHGETSEEDIQLSKTFGGHGGYAFSDIELIKVGQRTASIAMRAKERIISVALRVEFPAELTLTHGGSSGVDHALPLASDEYVNTMEIHWAKKGLSTRIFYLKLSTNVGNSVAAGNKTKHSSNVSAPEGFQLSGFFGRANREIYQLGFIWTRRNATTKLLTDTMGTAWYGKRIRNWVGPTIGRATDSACYRKRQIFGSGQSCSLGYSANGVSCLAQCPISYPVKCFEECIPQNDNCSGEILSKAASVISTVFSMVTAGIFGAILSSYKTAKRNFLCAANIVGVVKALIYYLSLQRTVAPVGTMEEMLAAAYQSDVVLFSMPIAVAYCLGEEVSGKVIITNLVYIIVENIVKQVIINGDQIVSSAKNVFALLQNTSAITFVENSTVEELQVLLNLNTTCGYQLKNLTDHITATIRNARNKTSTVKAKDIRIEMSNSPLVLRDIPTATNNCMHELMQSKDRKTAFETRDLIRKTLGVIIDQLVEKNCTDMGQSVAKDDYTADANNLALVVLGGMDPTGIAWMLSQFVQPTCGPTAFLGEIDDGTLYDALGLKTMDEAFKGSYGTWTKKGDGMINFLFESTDPKDVTVVIHLGGEEIHRVKVPAKSTVKFSDNISNMQDKALYMNRRRRNMIGIPTASGGSLALWIPRSSQGGHLTMHVRINGT